MSSSSVNILFVVFCLSVLTTEAFQNDSSSEQTHPKSCRQLALKIEDWETKKISQLSEFQSSTRNPLFDSNSVGDEYFQKFFPELKLDYSRESVIERVGEKFFTETMLLRSRFNHGNFSRGYAAFFQKLYRGECVNLLVFGGSMSCGSTLNESLGELTYSTLLENWLNSRFPCEKSTGGKHIVFNRCEKGTGAGYALFNFDTLTCNVEKRIDLALLEFAVNDLYPRAKYFGALINSVRMYNELLVRKFWRRGIPVMYFEATFKEEETPPYFSSAEPLHESIIKHFDLPSISITKALSPEFFDNYAEKRNDTKLYRCRLFNDKVHLTSRGHHLITFFLAWHLLNDMRGSFSVKTDPEELWETPSYLHVAEKFREFENAVQVAGCDFNKGDKYKCRDMKLLVERGWRHKSDVAWKPGYISYYPSSKIIAPIPDDTYMMIAGTLKTYQDIGVMKIEINCQIPGKEPYRSISIIDGLWNLSTSELYSTTYTIPKDCHGEVNFVNLNVTDFDSSRLISKTKLLTISFFARSQAGNQILSSGFCKNDSKPRYSLYESTLVTDSSSSTDRECSLLFKCRFKQVNYGTLFAFAAFFGCVMYIFRCSRKKIVREMQ